MDKKHFIAKIAETTGLTAEVVSAVVDGFEIVVEQALKNDEQIHIGGFLQIGTILKRPVDMQGRLLHQDTDTCKMRYRLPYCRFSGRMTKPFQRELCNIVKKERA